MKPILVANWTTIRGLAPNVLSFTQDEEEWPDFKGYQDLGLQIDCSDVSGGGAAGGTAVTLNLESAPTVDEALFQPVCPPILLTAASTALSTKTIRVPSTQALARFLRWRITVDPSASGTWSATFRIRAIPVRSRFFVPPDVAGCRLWVRADLGLSAGFSGGGLIAGWADQSGNGNDLSQATGGKQPTLNAIDTSYNNAPTLSFGAGRGMRGTFSPPDTGELFIVGNGDGSAGANRVFTDGDVAAPFRFRATSATAVDFTRVLAVAATVVSTGSPHVYCVELNAVDTKIFQDALTAPTAGDPGPGGAGTFSVGFDSADANALMGKVAEVILYDTVLSESDRSRVMRYLGARYGIRITQ